MPTNWNRTASSEKYNNYDRRLQASIGLITQPFYNLDYWPEIQTENYYTVSGYKVTVVKTGEEKTYTCLCPDFTQNTENEVLKTFNGQIKPSTIASNLRSPRSWAGSLAGPFNPCKHITAAKRPSSLGYYVPIPPEYVQEIEMSDIPDSLPLLDDRITIVRGETFARIRLGLSTRANIKTLTTGRSLIDEDLNYTIFCNNEESINIVLNSTTLETPEGFKCVVVRGGNGAVNFTSSETIHSAGTSIVVENGYAEITFKSTGEWIVTGDLVSGGSGGSDYIEFTTQVTESRSVTDADLNKIIECNSTSDITITLNSATLTTPENFQCAIRRIGTGKVILSTPGTLEASGTEITKQKQAVYVNHKGSNNWIILGALTTESEYLLKSEFAPNNLILSAKNAAPLAEAIASLPYTLTLADHGKEKSIASGTGVVKIPDAVSGWLGFICLISLDGTGAITFEASSGATPILIFSGGSTFNKLKKEGGTVSIRVRSALSNIWKIEGALEE